MAFASTPYLMFLGFTIYPIGVLIDVLIYGGLLALLDRITRFTAQIEHRAKWFYIVLWLLSGFIMLWYFIIHGWTISYQLIGIWH